MSEELWMGIDLGTTYSCMAYLDPLGRIVVVKNEEGEYTTPSVVQYDGDEIIVGSVAVHEAGARPETTVAKIKRLMGKGQEAATLIDGRALLPEEISSEIIKKLVKDFQSATGQTVSNIAVSHPAYFGAAEREATKRAVKLAGNYNIKLVEEPVAAALAYARESGGLSAGGNNNAERTIFVYDLGGGTFDVTILKYSQDNYTVIAQDGNRVLGGKDWDQRVMDMILKKTGVQESELDDNDRAELTFYAEDVKKILTGKSSTRVSFKRKNGELTRDEFEQATKDLLEETLTTCDALLKATSMKTNGAISTMNDVDELILVGGSSRMPQVAAALERKYNRQVKFFEPDQCVAMGAAIYGKFSETVVIEKVLSKTFGVLAFTDNIPMVSNIAYKNSKIPVSNERHFSPREDNQRIISVRIFENSTLEGSPNYEDTALESSIEIGHFDVDLAPNSRRSDDIAIQFTCDDEGLLKITVRCPNMPPYSKDLVIGKSGGMENKSPLESAIPPEW